MDSRNGQHIHRIAPLPPNNTNTAQAWQRELARLELIRLDQPRPDADRFTNDYVDAPKLPQRRQPGTGSQSAATDKKHLDTDHFLTKQPCSPQLLTKQPPCSADNFPLHPYSPSTKKSPCAIHGHRDLKEKLSDASVSKDVEFSPPRTTLDDLSQPSEPGIICPQCGLCRCSACITPKKLPSYWLCHGNFECSADNLVDQISCLCCVKGLLYHCDRENTTADHPCSCDGSGCCQRWTLMSLLSVTCLPCLLCYWPCRGLASCAQRSYASYHRQGCQCPPPPSANSSLESSPVASIRPLTRRTSPPLPPSRPGHARRIPTGTANIGFSKTGVFL